MKCLWEDKRCGVVDTSIVTCGSLGSYKSFDSCVTEKTTICETRKNTISNSSFGISFHGKAIYIKTTASCDREVLFKSMLQHSVSLCLNHDWAAESPSSLQMKSVWRGWWCTGPSAGQSSVTTTWSWRSEWTDWLTNSGSQQIKKVL